MPIRLAASFLALLAAFAPAARAQDEKKAALIKITVPADPVKVEISIEDQPTKTNTGAVRTFVTPPLDPGKNYTYKIVAKIVPNNYTIVTRTKEIAFKAGETVDVDLSKVLPDDKVVIRWVPTPADVVGKMAELAKIGKDDVVYDLGCGDGIMLTTALKKVPAKKGVGIDIDPKRVAEAKQNVKDAGLENKIEIKQGDVLALKPADVSEATVVMLYMADELNLRLRPMLWKALKPGSRVVSHRFIMGDWKPTKTVTVTGEDGDEYVLHMWEITGNEGK